MYVKYLMNSLYILFVWFCIVLFVSFCTAFRVILYCLICVILYCFLCVILYCVYYLHTMHQSSPLFCNITFSSIHRKNHDIELEQSNFCNRRCSKCCMKLSCIMHDIHVEQKQLLISRIRNNPNSSRLCNKMSADSNWTSLTRRKSLEVLSRKREFVSAILRRMSATLQVGNWSDAPLELSISFPSFCLRLQMISTFFLCMMEPVSCEKQSQSPSFLLDNAVRS